MEASETHVNFVLLFVIALFAQQGFFLWQIHKLINKVMAKSLTEYVKPEGTKVIRTAPRPEDPEEFNALTGIGL